MHPNAKFKRGSEVTDSKDTDKKLTFWAFLNSSFGLWLCAAIFITGAGGALTYFQAQAAESRKNAQYIEKLDLEISYRFSQELLMLYDLTDMGKEKVTLKPGKTREDVLNVYRALRDPSSKTLGFLYQEFRDLGMLALVAELRRMLKNPERREVDVALSALSMIPTSLEFRKVSPTDVNEMGRFVLQSMARRCRQGWFAFVDCPETRPFC